MSPSWNQRRAMPVVTITTFHVGESGVASRSRLITPTRSSVVPSRAWAIGLMESVLPVPVPATMPKPRRRAPSARCASCSSAQNPSASARSSSPLDLQSTVSRSSVNANSMVSQAARVGAITMIRRASPDATNASWSGGRYGSVTRRNRSPPAVTAASPVSPSSFAACPQARRRARASPAAATTRPAPPPILVSTSPGPDAKPNLPSFRAGPAPEGPCRTARPRWAAGS